MARRSIARRALGVRVDREQRHRERQRHALPPDPARDGKIPSPLRTEFAIAGGRHASGAGAGQDGFDLVGRRRRPLQQQQRPIGRRRRGPIDRDQGNRRGRLSIATRRSGAYRTREVTAVWIEVPQQVEVGRGGRQRLRMIASPDERNRDHAGEAARRQRRAPPSAPTRLAARPQSDPHRRAEDAPKSPRAPARCPADSERGSARRSSRPRAARSRRASAMRRRARCRAARRDPTPASAA